MSEDKDSTSNEFRLDPPPISRVEERAARAAAKRLAWNEANKERRAAQGKARYEANREAVNARARELYHANRPERLAKSKAYNVANRDLIRAKHKARYEANRERESERKRSVYKQRVYGLTNQDYDAMVDAQRGRCACCKTKFGILKAIQPRIDHCHATGRIRGILCDHCNTILGRANDDSKLLRALARYLERARRDAAEDDPGSASGICGRVEALAR